MHHTRVIVFLGDIEEHEFDKDQHCSAVVSIVHTLARFGLILIRRCLAGANLFPFCGLFVLYYSVQQSLHDPLLPTRLGRTAPTGITPADGPRISGWTDGRALFFFRKRRLHLDLEQILEQTK